jgi:prepilin-type N-terminal cleavage/methylation domain-containing protein
MKQHIIHKHDQRGFTFLEVVAAMSVITLALLGLASLAVQTIQARSVKEHVLVASMLAQEGIELVRGVRDENMFLRNRPFDEDIADTDNSFIIDHRGRTNIDDTPNSDDDAAARLFLNAGFYSHDPSGVPSPYSRLIRIVPGVEYFAVSSTVTWQDRSTTRNYVAETKLYKWQ